MRNTSTQLSSESKWVFERHYNRIDKCQISGLQSLVFSLAVLELEITVHKQDTEADYRSLLRNYVALCNEAIEANRNKFPYSHLWRAAMENQDNTHLTFELIDDRPKCDLPIKLSEERLIPREEKNPDCNPYKDRVMVVKMSYLEKVLNNPAEFIANPALLDWEWLTLAKIKQQTT
jgi:hypothetical protein